MQPTIQGVHPLVALRPFVSIATHSPDLPDTRAPWPTAEEWDKAKAKEASRDKLIEEFRESVRSVRDAVRLIHRLLRLPALPPEPDKAAERPFALGIGGLVPLLHMEPVMRHERADGLIVSLSLQQPGATEDDAMFIHETVTQAVKVLHQDATALAAEMTSRAEGVILRQERTGDFFIVDPTDTVPHDNRNLTQGNRRLQWLVEELGRMPTKLMRWDELEARWAEGHEGSFHGPSSVKKKVSGALTRFFDQLHETRQADFRERWNRAMRPATADGAISVYRRHELGHLFSIYNENAKEPTKIVGLFKPGMVELYWDDA